MKPASCLIKNNNFPINQVTTEKIQKIISQAIFNKNSSNINSKTRYINFKKRLVFTI